MNTVIITDYAQMLVTEALIAVAVMTVSILIVIIAPMLAAMIVVMVSSFHYLRRQQGPCCERENYK